MTPLVLSKFTATSCIGRGTAQTLAALLAERSGLAPCRFDTVRLDTHVGEVADVDAQGLPHEWRRYDCRNNRLAEIGLQQDGFLEAVEEAALAQCATTPNAIASKVFAVTFIRIDRAEKADKLGEPSMEFRHRRTLPNPEQPAAASQEQPAPASQERATPEPAPDQSSK